jgi:hypothetical protein
MKQNVHVANAGFKTTGDAEGTALFQKKKKAEARLSCSKAKLRSHMIVQARLVKAVTLRPLTLNFRDREAPTVAADTHVAESIEYKIPERAAQFYRQFSDALLRRKQWWRGDKDRSA